MDPFGGMSIKVEGFPGGDLRFLIHEWPFWLSPDECG